MATTSTSAGTPRSAFSGASNMRCRVVRVVPRPRARAAGRRFWTAGEIDAEAACRGRAGGGLQHAADGGLRYRLRAETAEGTLRVDDREEAGVVVSGPCHRCPGYAQPGRVL